MRRDVFISFQWQPTRWDVKPIVGWFAATKWTSNVPRVHVEDSLLPCTMRFILFSRPGSDD